MPASAAEGYKITMGVQIDDLSDRNRSLRASWWRWRATVEVVRSFNLFEDERLDDLSDGIGEFSPAETRAITEHLESYITAHVAVGERVLLDGTVTTLADDGVFHRSPAEQHQNYSADYEWLIEFTAFCRTCDGLYIS